MTPPSSGPKVQKNYRITRAGDGRIHCVAVPAGDLFFPAYAIKRFPLHWNSGFEIGNSGSGPAELALAILADWTAEAPVFAATPDPAHDPQCVRYHKQFQWAFLAARDVRLEKGEMLTIPGAAVERFLAEMDPPQASLPCCGAHAPASDAHNDLG